MKDGKIVLVGTNNGSSNDMDLAHYNSNGSLDRINRLKTLI